MHSTANVINLQTVNDIESWLQKPNNTYIGRETKNIAGSKWGNPFKLRDYNNCRKTVVSLYEEYVSSNRELLNSIDELKGKTLGCWCAPRLCHGSVLHRLAGNTPVQSGAVQSNMNRDTLQQMNKDQLIDQILKMNEDFVKVTQMRLYFLERNSYMHEQYGRRESFEIVGIPKSVGTEALEDEVIDILKEADVKVEGDFITKKDICAVHRIGKQKATTIVRVVNRKFAWQALISGKNLKDSRRYGGGKIYINHSLCKEFQFLNYAVRQAKKNKLIHKYSVRSGVTYVQMDEREENWKEIGHYLDLENLRIPVPQRNRTNWT